MIGRIDVDKKGVVCCTSLYDGRIEKVLLKKNMKIIYVCEECETTWLSLEDLFDETKCYSFMPYIESLGMYTKGDKPDWESILKVVGHIHISEVDDIAKKHNISVYKLK